MLNETYDLTESFPEALKKRPFCIDESEVNDSIERSSPSDASRTFKERLELMFSLARQQPTINMLIDTGVTEAVIRDLSIQALSEFIEEFCGTNKLYSDAFANLLKNEFQ